jgi:hypothetical protein
MPMTIREATEEDFIRVAKELAAEHGKVWEELSEAEQIEYRTEATFCFSWFCV